MHVHKYLFHRAACQTQCGFTLIEILIVLLMTAVALMALGTFSVAMMDSGTKSRERLLAVHLAEQVIEEWQVDKVNDFPPVVSATCAVTAGTSSALPAPQTCTPGAQTQFTVTMARTQAQAPLPKKPNNADYYYKSTKATRCQNGGSFPDMCDMYGNPLPYVKAVTVSWTHKGDSPNCDGTIGPIRNCIYLTHLTRI